MESKSNHSFPTAWIIHIFAIFHALVAFICASFTFSDQLILTLLTVAMTLLICFKRKSSIEFMAACVILVNIIGYLLGTSGAKLVAAFLPHMATVHALSSLITTEIMGWCIYLLTSFGQNKVKDKVSTIEMKHQIVAFICIILLILVIRIIYTLVFRSDIFSQTKPYVVLSNYFSNPIVFLIGICLNIIYIRQIRVHGGEMKYSYRIFFSIFFILGLSSIMAFFACLGHQFNIALLDHSYFIQMATIASIVEITVYAFLFMIDNVITFREQMYIEREEANQARYQYMMLKQQVDPHFLFNSLNILDCLVTEKKTEEASLYIHKLAGIYRYMLKNEGEVLVELREELTFVNMYIDLLKVRFPKGFSVETDIPDALLGKKIVPCTLQLLIENAIKHNIVNETSPLVIRIQADEEKISVTNQIIPKLSAQIKSNKLGLKYIDNQYRNLIGKPIKIIHNEQIHQVILPW